MNTRRPARRGLAAHRLGARALIVAAVVLFAGCARFQSSEYPQATWRLDDKNELAISTYPSSYSRTETSIPFVYQSVRGPESIYFQFFVRDAATRTGPNPHVRSILIRSFTYQLADAPAVTLITDYQANFWMQANPHHHTTNPDAKTPVSCVPGQRVTVRANLMLNDQEHSIESVLTCESHVTVLPLVLVWLLSWLE
jgi:hypothetical protein